MTITSKFLEEIEACEAGLAWFRNQEASESIDVLNALMKDGRHSWAKWLMLKLFKKDQLNRFLDYEDKVRLIKTYEYQSPPVDWSLHLIYGFRLIDEGEKEAL